MIISGLVLQIDPARSAQVGEQLLGYRGVTEVKLLPGSTKVVCVLEAPSAESSVSLLEGLVRIEGVHTAMPTYIHEVEEEGPWNSPAVHS